ncbi:MAG: hypothetical protein A2651_01240 [Candidatus Yanofskybacteria bacterium RIFCSPHIGHO2_01_FULL_42_12]|uniref:Uncharacterized protein n=1 Tax=Candidatus Yanofskybacteria bacterium RIFCSPLOWO2_01_FULL_42_49 TaxID=1802694 RepID=A0A1F8GFN8_9BACT|nr:MAG: hypothetical protein A2651_01240 [Candidatus Yanofskybacteria bacterium RIFCSPHIGHO2_01_FULL_42_12]OGN23536.1 MAG: hypothetical protein A2918_00610 [Candidatus Yanofskybacteria bacterium RIFCSPLOWO2_01_FULL_42_49]
MEHKAIKHLFGIPVFVLLVVVSFVCLFGVVFHLVRMSVFLLLALVPVYFLFRISRYIGLTEFDVTIYVNKSVFKELLRVAIYGPKAVN